MNIFSNRWVVAILILAIIVGLLIVTKANFGVNGGMAGKGISIQVGDTGK